LRSSLRALRWPWPRRQGAPAAIDSPESRERLGARFTDPRTLISFGLVAVIVAIALSRTHFDYRQTLDVARQINLLLYAAAFAAFYLSFGVRAVRWRLLLANAGENSHLPGILRIVMVSWFANCLLPAKMGDFYRAYLLRQTHPISGSKAFGTIVTERFLDFLVLMGLLIASGLISFHNHVPQAFVPALLTGLVIAMGMVAGLLVARLSDGRITRLLPASVAARVAHFREGLIDSLGNLPTLFGLTLLVWLLESTRLYLVLQALPLHFSISLPQVIFIALVASLLTTIPALPGGLVLVEGGIVAVLVFFGLNPNAALSVALLDRFISYWSLIGVGLAVFLFSREARKHAGKRAAA
jgi:uncharacterized protein (TIRG00374 family)